MLRECARYEALAKIMLYSEDFYNFFRYVEVSTFDIASDAFSTFKVCSIFYILIIILFNLNCYYQSDITHHQICHLIFIILIYQIIQLF